MYKVGELVLYNEMGVCKIADIAARDLSGVDGAQLYYVLKPLYQDCVISTPVNTDKVFMRPILTKAEANRLIDGIPSIHAEAYNNRALRQLAEHYEACLKSYDCAEWMELTMSLYAKRQIAKEQNRKFGSVDERFMRRAEDLLFGELAAALGIAKDAVPAYIAERLGEKERDTGHQT